MSHKWANYLGRLVHHSIVCVNLSFPCCVGPTPDTNFLNPRDVGHCAISRYLFSEASLPNDNYKSQIRLSDVSLVLSYQGTGIRSIRTHQNAECLCYYNRDSNTFTTA